MDQWEEVPEVRMVPPRKRKANCAKAGCEKEARATGLCEKHYRQAKYGHREGGQGNAAQDETIYKVRIRLSIGGSKSVYYADYGKALRTATAAEEAGTLLYFGRYVFLDDLTNLTPDCPGHRT